MSVVSFGINNYYQCGHSFNTMIDNPTPSTLLKDFKIKKISCGEDHAIFQTGIKRKSLNSKYIHRIR